MTASQSRPEFAGGAPDRGRYLAWIEAVALIALGFSMMTLFYAGTVSNPGDEIGAPGHDSFYHIAMASMLPEIGAASEFPWLKHTYFRDEGHEFVSHHWGFHVMLVPFVKLAEWTKGDPLAGGRWAVSLVFGINLFLFHLLLRWRRVPFHWLWIALFFLLPDQFFSRHGFVRAIGPSLLFMQLILLALFAQRIRLAALAVAAYVHLYLGAVMFGPILVAIYALAQVLGPREDRRVPWKLVWITAAAWGLGVVTYPYAGGVFEFLRLQVFGSGLSPDIEVGREWKPYTDAWFLLTMAAPLLTIWVFALMLRLRMGPRLTAEDATLMVLQFLFLALTFKARRFIEYWPPICLASAAYAAAPPLAEIAGTVRRWFAERTPVFRRQAGGVGVLALAAACGFAWSRVAGTEEAVWLLARWPLWAAPLALLAISSVARILLANDAGTRVRGTAGWRYSPAMVRTVVVVLIGTLLPAAALAINARGLSSAVRQLRCYYDLDDVRSAMQYLKDHSRPGDVVFTDDWDIFPPYFFFNRHNHYIVGLDPKFTHHRDPDLWNRYVKITRGQVPSTIALSSDDGGPERATVALEDIRDHFGARYVIADREHRPLSEALARAPEFAELVFPAEDFEVAREAPYVVFRIREPGEAAPVVPRSATGAPGPIYLSELRPLSVSQGWGDLGADRTVDGNPIRLAGQVYSRGIGTHAPARLLYEVPDGCAWFEAVVGIDDETEGRGSAIASILLDGRMVYESPRLTGNGAPAVIRIPVSGARQIMLEVDATPDGRRFDHLCWADARWVPEDKESVGAPGAAPLHAEVGR